jgi:hypothetical protein
MNETRYTIKNAFIDAEKLRLAALPSDTEIGWIPSSYFKRKMSSLIKVQRRSYWKYFNTAGKRAAVIMIALAVLFGSAMSVQAIREPVIKFIVEVYDKFTEIFYHGDDPGLNVPETIEIEYTLSKVPEGYRLAESTRQTFALNTMWSNESGEDIHLSQNTVVNTGIVIDTENIPYQNIVVGDYEAIYYVKNNCQTLIWNNDEYAFILICPLSISYEITLSMAEGLMPK